MAKYLPIVLVFCHHWVICIIFNTPKAFTSNITPFLVLTDYFNLGWWLWKCILLMCHDTDTIRYYWDVHVFFYTQWPLSSIIWFSYCFSLLSVCSQFYNCYYHFPFQCSLFMKCYLKSNLFKQIIIEDILGISHCTKC